jgi:hypothetical protein
MSKLPNDCICLFYFQVGWGGGKFEGCFGKKNVISEPLFYRRPLLLRRKKNNQNQTNATGAHNLKEFNNTTGWL